MDEMKPTCPLCGSGLTEQEPHPRDGGKTVFACCGCGALVEVTPDVYYASK